MSSRVKPVAVALCLAVAAIIAAGPAAAQAAAPPAEAPTTADDHYGRARAAFIEERYEAALDNLRRAVELDERAVYVYDIARTLEAMGRYAESYQSFLRARALPDAAEDLEDLARAGAERLAPRRKKAVVRVGGLEAGAIAQIDDAVVVEPDRDHLLAPGKHQLCITGAAGAEMRCWTRSLSAGLRVAWPLEDAPTGRGTLRMPDGAPPASVVLDGHRMVVDLALLRRIRVDIGHHEVLLEVADGPTYRNALDVLPGRQVDLALAGPVVGAELAGQALAPSEGVDPFAWVTLGVGGAAAVAGVVLLVVAEQQRRVGTDEGSVR